MKPVILELLATFKTDILQTIREEKALQSHAHPVYYTSDIIIQTEIPREVLADVDENGSQKTITASTVGATSGHGATVSEFLTNQVLGMFEDWDMCALPADSDPQIRDWGEFTASSSKFSAMSVENDNQFNVKVNIKV